MIYLKMKIIAITWRSNRFFVISLEFVNEILYLNAIAQIKGDTMANVTAIDVKPPQSP